MIASKSTAAGNRPNTSAPPPARRDAQNASNTASSGLGTPPDPIHILHRRRKRGSRLSASHVGGMSLAQLGDLLRAHGMEATVFYASETSVDAFRSLAQENLKTTGDFLLVNYQRATLGRAETGHISPLAACNAATDRLLILDVAAYKYPPVWVSTEALWNAMNTVDSSSGRARGFIVVREAGARQRAQAERPASADARATISRAAMTPRSLRRSARMPPRDTSAAPRRALPPTAARRTAASGCRRTTPAPARRARRPDPSSGTR